MGGFFFDSWKSNSLPDVLPRVDVGRDTVRIHVNADLSGWSYQTAHWPCPHKEELVRIVVNDEVVGARCDRCNLNRVSLPVA